MSQYGFLLTIAAVAMALMFLGFSAFADIDFSKLPPTAAEKHAAMKGRTVQLAQAIATAEKTGEGLTSSATTLEEGGKVSYEIMIHSASATRKIRVSAETGEVTMNEEVPQIPGDAFTGDLVSTESGLQYVILKKGDGAKPKGPESTVKVHYTGWTVDGNQFDSSVARGTPATFPLNRVIAGWTEGVGDMQLGEKRKLIIPYALAYGERGRPPVIPPKALLVFDVELLEIVGE